MVTYGPNAAHGIKTKTTKIFVRRKTPELGVGLKKMRPHSEALEVNRTSSNPHPP